MRIQLPPLWGNIIVIIFCMPFLYQCYFLIREDGNPMEWIICLIPIIIIVNSVRNIAKIIKNRRMGIDDLDGEDAEEYGAKTASSDEKQRLLKLEDLYHANLISKQEYEEKRREILRNL